MEERAPTSSGVGAARLTARLTARGARARDTLFACAAALVAFALYGATLQSNVYGDGVALAEYVGNGPYPYYNVLYVPAGWTLHRALSPFLGWDPLTALGWMSALSGAAGVGVTTASLLCALGERAPRPAIALLAALVALAPCTWFFSTTAEVHALQFLCASLGLRLALAARDQRGARRALVLACALAIATAGHLSSVVLGPLFVLIAEERERERWLRSSLRTGARAAAMFLGIVALAVAAAAALGRANALLDPLRMFRFFASGLLERARVLGPYSPAEVLDYLWDEFARPSGALLVAVAALRILAPRARARLLACALLGALPLVVPLSLGGVREDGGYFVALLPALALAAAEPLARAPGAPQAGRVSIAPRARTVSIALGLLGLLQLGAGRAALSAHARGIDAREWAARVQAVAPRSSIVLCTSLERQLCLAHAPAIDMASDVERMFDLVPRRCWDRPLADTVGVVARALSEGKAVWIDAEILDGDERSASMRFLAEELRELPLLLEPAAELAPGRPLAYRVAVDSARLPATSAAAPR